MMKVRVSSCAGSMNVPRSSVAISSVPTLHVHFLRQMMLLCRSMLAASITVLAS